jgi:putative phosphoesterase
MKIILISDTHSYLDERILAHCRQCDEIWHAGDIGNPKLADQLAAVRPLQAVYGNIDGEEIRQQYPHDLWIEREGLQIWMTHIGGYPPKYNRRVKDKLQEKRPDIFVCGHSHILKVVKDQERGGMLCLNPGAAGRQGFQKVRTMLRFELEQGHISKMEVIELGPK